MSVNYYFVPNPIFLQDKTGQTFREKYLNTTSKSEEPIITGFPIANKRVLFGDSRLNPIVICLSNNVENTTTKVERGE